MNIQNLGKHPNSLKALEKNQFKKGNQSRLGLKNDDEHNRKIGLANSQALKGKVIPSDVRKKISESLKGRKKPEGFGKLLSESRRGSKSHFWKGGKTELAMNIRNHFSYSEWRTKVFERDNFTCQDCGTKGGQLNADHQKPFSFILKHFKIKSIEDALKCSLLWDVSNGKTLCEGCHRKTPTFAKKAINYQLQTI